MMLFALAAWGGEASRPVRIGVLAWQGLEEAEIRWSSLMSELQDRLPGRSLALRHFDLAGMAGVRWVERAASISATGAQRQGPRPGARAYRSLRPEAGCPAGRLSCQAA